MPLVFERFGSFFLNSLIFTFSIFLGIVFENIFFIKTAPVLYTPFIITVFFYKKRRNSYLLNILVFSLGLVEDIICSRILGVTAIFCLLFFILLNKIVSNFVKDLAKYIITVGGLILYTGYQILSLLYLRNQHHLSTITNKYLINLQIIAFVCTTIIVSFIYFTIKDSRKRFPRAI